MKIQSADGVYTSVTERFQRGALKDLCRSLKACQHDAAALISWGGGMSDTAKIIQACNLNNPKWHRLMNVVLSPEGICTAINTVGGGNLEPKILAMRGRNPDNPSDRTPGVLTKQRAEINKDGMCNALTSVQKDNLVLAIDEQNAAFHDDAFGTLTTDGSSPKHNNRVIADAKGFDPDKPYDVVEVESKGKKIGAILQGGRYYFVRKLTPRECLRLMGWKDEQIDRIIACGMSNSQMYKQAGNGIVVDTLEAIFTMLFLSEAAESDIDVSNYVEVNQIGF